MIDGKRLVACGLAAVAIGAASAAGAQRKPAAKPEYYEIRTYHLRKDARQGDVERFYAEVAIPALKRAGAGPIGVFLPTEPAPDDPAVYVLITHKSLEAVSATAQKLAADKEYQQAGAGFLALAPNDPPYARVNSMLLRAFDAWPRLKAPGPPKPRLFELRTYESPTDKAHVAKVFMFNNGEMPIFSRAGLEPVFFADTIIGPRQPNLVYMLTFEDMAANARGWTKFGADPVWKELSTRPGLGDVAVVNHITRIFLRPAACSEI